MTAPDPVPSSMRAPPDVATKAVGPLLDPSERTGGPRRLRAALCVYVPAVVLRLALLPWWHGQDFEVWRLATAATLRGSNIFAHHPRYPGGPFAYIPLFLYLELPFHWAADHSGMSFTVLGKLPMLWADIEVGRTLFRLVERATGSHRRAAVAASCFLFDPLVLYNSAVYGRFDSIASALLLSYVGALLGSKRTTVKAALSYGLAVAAKTYPILAIVAVCRVAGRRTWLIAAAVAGCSVLLLLPYIAAPRPLVHDLVLYDLSREAQGLSPQLAVLAYTGQHARTVVGVGSAVVFAVGVVVLAVRLGKDVTAQVTAAVMLFIVTSTLVLEQYLTWPLPLLILLAFRGRHADRPSLLAAGALTVLGLLDSESFHPLGRSSAVIGGLVGAVGLAWLVACVSRPRRTGG